MAKIIVVGCVDERLPESVRIFLDSEGLIGHYVLANAPAPSLNYKDQKLTLTKVAEAKGISEVWLIDHLDCAGFALAQESDDLQNHQRHLSEARTDLIENFGFATVRTFIAKPNGDEKWDIEEQT